ncbi:hypothetical protein TALC_00932 [Thermoplasmatales archaeon BRNA1]|nr:hypothetical protein TALC_00932 [Thermoplasmatales archaeon BRNA1]
MGRFVISNSKDGGYFFSLYAGNNEIIGTSQVYKSKKSAMNGVGSVGRNYNSDIADLTVENVPKYSYPEWEIFKDSEDQFRFRLKAMNGEIILAASQGYAAKATAIKCIESVRKNAKSEIVDKTEF